MVSRVLRVFAPFAVLLALLIFFVLTILGYDDDE